jgi:8-amino-7-oxononanoate synthase
MNYYDSELQALRKSHRHRVRETADYSLKDFASNDYLGLAANKELHTSTCNALSANPVHAPKASMLVGGYHPIHRDFERRLCEINGFEDALLFGSGFNANIALIESLVRKTDALFMDKKFHASGVLASELKGIEVTFFPHNDANALQKLLQNCNAKRKIVAVEGIYSMDGDLMERTIFDICDAADALLIVDEAHSSGVVGTNLMGVYDLFNIQVKPNHIKMGTLGKAYGSFGAYVLASAHIVEYLVNRAKPFIYATALSLYDAALAHNALDFIVTNKTELKAKIQERQNIAKEVLGFEMPSLILPIPAGGNKQVLILKEMLQQKGFHVGAIRQPTVENAILRIIARIEYDAKTFEHLCKLVKKALCAGA